MNTLRDEFEDLEPAEKTQAAFNESAQLPVAGDVVLHPWTCARHGVAIQMGSEVIQAMGPHVSPFMQGGNYPNRFRDVAIVLWLSHLDREEIKNLCALPRPEFRVIEAYEWADKVGAKFGSSMFFEGIKILDRIVRDILASIFDIEEESAPVKTDKKKDTDRLGKSNIASEQSKPVDTTKTL